jgi:hypothetical protein
MEAQCELAMDGFVVIVVVVVVIFFLFIFAAN